MARSKIDVDRRGNRVAFVIRTILGAMKMERLDGIGGVGQGKSVAKHVACEGIVATRLAETEGERREVPFAVLDGIGQKDPTVLGVGTGAKEFQLGLSTRRRTDVPAKQTEHAVGQLDPPELLERLVPIDVCITQDRKDTRWDVIIDILNEICIGQSRSNDDLVNLFMPRDVVPFIGIMGFIFFIQQNNAGNQRVRTILFEALTNLFGTFLVCGAIILSKQPYLFGDGSGLQGDRGECLTALQMGYRFLLHANETMVASEEGHDAKGVHGAFFQAIGPMVHVVDPR